MHIDGYEHQDRAEIEAQLCRANARAEAAEQHARELDYKLRLALHDSEQGIADADESEACLKAENAALRAAAKELVEASIHAFDYWETNEKSPNSIVLARRMEDLQSAVFAVAALLGPDDAGESPKAER